MSVSKENFHKQRASLLDRTTFRFFMISKEVQQLAYSLRHEGRASGNDWSAMYMEALKLQAAGKVAYVQPYNPNALQDVNKTFVVIIQDDWMLQMCILFSQHNAWAGDSTFKTNVYGLPLYAAVLSNQNGTGIPLWLMMCTSDPGTCQESVALELTIRMIFWRMGSIRPNAIVIDKCPQELNAILSAVKDDPACWAEHSEGQRVQVACHVLVCWFHVKKAWVENLLPQVPRHMQEHVYSSMCNLMHSSSEDDFEARFQRLLLDYSNHENIQRYVSNGWCSKSCVWRERWPKFGRLFPHGNVDTTNLVERLWQYVKYTLLDARINRPALDLLHALVGNARSGSWMGGTLLEFFKQKQELADSGRFAVYGSSKSATKALAAGEKLCQRYKTNPETLQVVNESTLLFKIQSMTSDSWYHVSMQSSYYDCPDWSSQCKHLYGLRLILQSYFPMLHAILPIVDSVHAMADLGTSDGMQQCAQVFETGSGCDDKALDTDMNGIGPYLQQVDMEIVNCIDKSREFLRQLADVLPQWTLQQKEVALKKLKISMENLENLHEPEEISLPRKGSIKQIQANVTQTRLGHGRLSCIIDGIGEAVEGCPEPAKKTRNTGSLKRKHQRGRNRVRFEKWRRVNCRHCCSKTLLVDGSNIVCCHTCHALLPLSQKHMSANSTSQIMNHLVQLWDGENPANGSIIACDHEVSHIDCERHLTVKLDDGRIYEKIYASRTRITFI
ncbi:hypothetical protein GOP47_0007655 [Adiantum capillus-veneris]|uniref:MULE transposase domain-containing protein n=1 Tax=Adiantum capillus-veneris TaxID=13818 RepID=A0A9D4ZLQ9_ADICA|nr:hypothetical protein GOP47_0007655 [Adiantum capillus-veneris]